MAKLFSKTERMSDSEVMNVIIKRMELNAMIKNSRIQPIIPIEEFADIIKRNFKENDIKSLIKNLVNIQSP